MTAAPVLVLASASPRRTALLHRIGVRHRVCPVDVDEAQHPGEAAEAYVRRMATTKARVGSMAGQGAPALGADTVVVLEGRVLHKPRDRADGTAMLCRLGGRMHRVLTAVALMFDEAGEPEVRLSESRVWMRPVSAVQAAAYWATGEPADKAGGYAIQGLGAVLVARLEGSHSGVVGLPLCETAELLAGHGLGPLAAWRGEEDG